MEIALLVCLVGQFCPERYKLGRIEKLAESNQARIARLNGPLDNK